MTAGPTETTPVVEPVAPGTTPPTETPPVVTPPAPAVPPSAPPATPPSTPPAEPVTPPAGKTTLTGEALEQELANVRQEAAASRVKARDSETAREATAAQLEAVQKALGLTKEGPPPEETITALQGSLRASQLETVAVRSAVAAGASPDLLVTHLLGSGKLVSITETDSVELRTAMDALVKETLEAQPALMGGTVQPPPSGGGEPPTGGAPIRKFTKVEIAAMTPEQMEEHSDAIDAWLAAGSPE